MLYKLHKECIMTDDFDRKTLMSAKSGPFTDEVLRFTLRESRKGQIVTAWFIAILAGGFGLLSLWAGFDDLNHPNSAEREQGVMMLWVGGGALAFALLCIWACAYNVRKLDALLGDK
jgi:hypothetical protein